jgi:hypothetical protein
MGRPWEDCADFNSWAAEQVRDLRPDLVVVSTSAPPRRSGVFVDGRQTYDTREIGTALAAGFDALFAELAALTPRTVLIADLPSGPGDPIECLTSGPADLGSCMFEPQWRSAYLRRTAVRAARDSQVEVVDMAPWVCWKRHCPVVVGDTLSYRDIDHLTATYARKLALPLGVRLGLWQRGS